VYDKKDSGQIEFFDTNFWIGENYLSRDISKNISSIEGILSAISGKNRIRSFIINSFEALYCYPKSGNDVLSRYLKELSVKGHKIFGCWFFEQELIADANSFEKALIDRISSGFRCMRLLPKSQKYPYKQLLMHDIYKICDCYNFPVIISLEEIDVTGNKEIEWEELLKIAQAYSNMPLIIDGGGSKELLYSSYIVALLENSSNIYLNTHNMLAANQIEDLSLRFGPERLLFDTYFPYYDPVISTDRLLSSGLRPEDKKKISSGNIKEIIGKIKS